MSVRREFGRFVVLGAALLALALFSLAAEIPCLWSGVERIVAVGDLHGDYDNFVSILRQPKVGLVDENLRWTAGRTHLVQIGDIMDRGDKAKDIFDLLMRLEKEAADAGGMVHVLLGNHEEANLAGIALSYPDYVSVDQFYSFLPASFKEAKEKEFVARQSPEEQARIKARGLDLETDAGWRNFWEKILETSKQAQGLDIPGKTYTANFVDTYGRWLLKKNVVIKIDDIVFAHAGISLRHSSWAIEKINATFRFELEIFARHPFEAQPLGGRFQPRMVYDPESPVRIRTDELNTSQEQMERILANLAGERMVIGHNFLTSEENQSPVVPAGDVIPLFGGRLWMIDTGIGYPLYGGRLYALIIQDGEFDHYAESEEPLTERFEETQTDDEPESPFEIEKYLQTATPLFVIPGGAGRTDPWRIRLELDEVKRWAQFKYIDRPRPAQIPDSYRYELAAYTLGRSLGLGFLPPLIERTINNVRGSLQIFVENAFRESDRKREHIRVDDPETFEEAMADVRVFLNLVNDRCDAERDRDILIQRGSGKVFCVDFSQAFAPKNGTVLGCDIVRCSRALYRKLRSWDRDEIDLLLGSYLNGDELAALHSRVGVILETIRKQIEIKGEDAVLF